MLALTPGPRWFSQLMFTNRPGRRSKLSLAENRKVLNNVCVREIPARAATGGHAAARVTFV